MPFNFYDTHTLLMAVQQLVPAATFLRDRYFPTNDASDIFATEDVLVEYRDGTRKLAPFVAPRKGGVTILRKGYNMERYTPPFVAPRRTLTLDELRKRGFGEALYSQLTPEQRQQVLIMRDADELGDLITNREEAMAAETMLTNGCIMKHIADDADKGDEMEIRFYSEASNPASYTPTTKWDASGAKIRADLGAMARMLTRRGLRAADLVCSPDVADVIVEDPDIKEMLDNRRYELGSVAPEGWRDAWNFVDTALRMIENAEYIGPLRVMKEDGITFGPVSEQDAVPDFYPYWFAWVEFSAEEPLTRTPKDYQHLL